MRLYKWKLSQLCLETDASMNHKHTNLECTDYKEILKKILHNINNSTHMVNAFNWSKTIY